MTAALIATGCGYEVAAICSAGRVPTLSTLCRRLPRPARVGVSAVAGVWLAIHLLDEVTDTDHQAPDQPKET